MSKDPITMFSVIATIGMVIMILGFKLVPKTRKVIETAGALVFHIGVFGILYHKVPIFLFISLATLVISLFILIDPLKIAALTNERFYKLIGYLFLVTAIIFSLAHLTDFPPALWLIPFVIYLIPYLIPSFRSNLKTILALSWFIILIYLSVIGYIIYAKYYPDSNLALPNFFHRRAETPAPDLGSEDENTSNTPLQTTQELPTTLPQNVPEDLRAMPPDQNNLAQPELPQIAEPSGPITKILKDADAQAVQLQKQYDDLKKRYDEVVRENERLRDENSKFQTPNNK